MTAAHLRIAAAAVGGLLGLLAIALPLVLSSDPSPLAIAVHVAIGWSFVAAGTVAWARRPDNRTGVLMTLTGLVWFARNAEWWDAAAGAHASDLALNLYLALLAHQLVVFPHGRARSRAERFLVGSAYALAVGGYVLAELFYDRRIEGCGDCSRNLLLVYGNHAAYVLADAVPSVLAIGLALAILGNLARRWWRASPPERRVLAPIVWTAPAAVAVAVATLLRDDLGVDFPSAVDTLLDWGAFVDAFIPIAFLIGLLRTRLHRTALGDLVVELSHLPSPGAVRTAMSRALGDPSLEVFYWLPDRGQFADADGTPVELPLDGARAVTVLDHAGETLAALVYDPYLLDDRAFVEAAGAAAALALANAQLQTQLRAQLAEVRASRARIVEAGDAERRRLERDLHDGAQQRLLGIRLALRLARGHSGDAEVVELLSEAETELDSSFDELRALARGIHPAVLTEEGLGPALETLARRAAIPVQINSLPDHRLPDAVEAAAYFVASEALANVVKHAEATHVGIALVHRNGHLLIDISDDGIGGVDATRGSGLLGLRDRVEALSGHLQVTSAAGSGTHLHVEIPCA